MKHAILPSLLVLLFVLGSSSIATHCTSSPLEPLFGGKGYYIDSYLCTLDRCLLALVVYEESNGIPNLQRQDMFYDNTCDGEFPADELVAFAFVADPS